LSTDTDEPRLEGVFWPVWLLLQLLRRDDSIVRQFDS